MKYSTETDPDGFVFQERALADVDYVAMIRAAQHPELPTTVIQQNMLVSKGIFLLFNVLISMQYSSDFTFPPGKDSAKCSSNNRSNLPSVHQVPITAGRPEAVWIQAYPRLLRLTDASGIEPHTARSRVPRLNRSAICTKYTAFSLLWTLFSLFTRINVLCQCLKLFISIIFDIQEVLMYF